MERVKNVLLLATTPENGDGTRLAGLCRVAIVGALTQYRFKWTGYPRPVAPLVAPLVAPQLRSRRTQDL
ncbi:hypothetical protein Thiowin_01513 [Thiorhodovibrio winogradskyi]|uniref:Uncharacterized protein n=1 Tax=Thiorhodovibrio winogradskyi TaxID=77007 RepID=A0ABZ0S7F7_9GAMM